jgi:hypothetical protein
MRKGRDHPGCLGKNPTIREKSTLFQSPYDGAPLTKGRPFLIFTSRPAQQALSALAKGDAIWKRLSSVKSTAV